MDLIARANWVQMVTRQACKTTGLSGSSDNERGTRPSSTTGQQNQPCMLLDGRLSMQYFMIVIAHLTAVKNIHRIGRVACTANTTLL